MDYRHDEAEGIHRGFNGSGADLEVRPTGELVKELFGELRVLVKEELRLAKTEARTEAKKAVTAVSAFGAAGVMFLVAVLAFAACLIAVGDSFLPLWLAALCVAALFALCGGVAIAAGKGRLKHLEPARPVRGLKEETKWAKDTMQGIRSRRHDNV